MSFNVNAVNTNTNLKKIRNPKSEKRQEDRNASVVFLFRISDFGFSSGDVTGGCQSGMKIGLETAHRHLTDATDTHTMIYDEVSLAQGVRRKQGCEWG